MDTDVRLRTLWVEAAMCAVHADAFEQPFEHAATVGVVAHEALELDLPGVAGFGGGELRAASRGGEADLAVEVHEPVGRHPVLDVLRAPISVLVERIAHDHGRLEVVED